MSEVDIDRSIEDDFLDSLVKCNKDVTIFLANGIKLEGTISVYDDVCIILERDGHSQLIYMNAISTVSPTSKLTIKCG